MSFNIIFPEVLAAKGSHHETIIVKSDDDAILFDPALPYDKVKKYNISKIIITDSDEDCWSNIDSYPDNIEVLSNKAILERVIINKNRKLISIKQGTNIGFLKNLRLIKLNPEVGRPATGVRFRLEGKEIVIAPELPPIIGKSEKNLMKNAIHIVGVGNFEKGNHKITFLEYIKLCDEELHPSAIYLTNLRKDILEHKKEVEKELSKRNGKLMKAGDVLISKELKKSITSEGIYLVAPHGKLIAEGKKSIIVKSKFYDVIPNHPYILCEDAIAYGNIFLKKGEKISLDTFHKLYNEHLISEKERKKWWSDKKEFYKYIILKFEPFKALKKIEVPQGVQTFIKRVIFKSNSNVTNIKKWKIPYDPHIATNEQLRDDFRLFAAVFSKLDKGEKVRIEANKENYFTKEILYKMVITLLKEIIKRKKAGKIEFTISEKKSESYEKFWNNLKKYLSEEEINILTDKNKIKKDSERSFSLQHHYWIKDNKKLFSHYDISLDIGNPNKFWKFSVKKDPRENILQNIISHHYCDDWKWFFLNEEISPSNPLWVGRSSNTRNCNMVVELINKGSYKIKKLNNGYQITFYNSNIKKREEDFYDLL